MFVSRDLERVVDVLPTSASGRWTSRCRARWQLVGLAAGQFGGALKARPQYCAVLGAFVLLLDIAILFAARRLFDRERLMSRWG